MCTEPEKSPISLLNIPYGISATQKRRKGHPQPQSQHKHWHLHSWLAWCPSQIPPCCTGMLCLLPAWDAPCLCVATSTGRAGLSYPHLEECTASASASRDAPWVHQSPLSLKLSPSQQTALPPSKDNGQKQPKPCSDRPPLLQTSVLSLLLLGITSRVRESCWESPDTRLHQHHHGPLSWTNNICLQMTRMCLPL